MKLTLAVATLAVTALAASQASATSARVRWACAADYFRYCSQHPEEGAAVRRCMSAHGQELSWSCINALVDAGEVSKSEVSRRMASGR